MVERPVGGASLRTPKEYEDYLALGETKHHEYYDGLCVVNPPSRSHSRTQDHLVDLIRPHCPDSHEVLTGWGWHIGPELDYEPDIMVTDRSAPDDDVLRLQPPLLVVEISSPSTRDVDWGKKRRSYAAGGAAWYWIVDIQSRETVVLENIDGEFIEVQRITAPAVATDPFPILMDPGATRSDDKGAGPGRRARPGRPLAHSAWGFVPPWVIVSRFASSRPDCAVLGDGRGFRRGKGRSMGPKHVANTPPLVPEINLSVLRTQPEPLLDETTKGPGSHVLPPVGRPPRRQLRRTVARFSAIVAAMGLVGATGFVRWDRTTIHTGGPVSIGSGVIGQRIGVGERTSFGGIVLLNRSNKPAIIENVRILGVTGGFEALDVRTNPVPFPANASPPASLAERHVVPVSKSRTDSGEPNEGLRLIIGARATEAGVAKARGVEVSYRVGHRRYRRSHDGSMYLCAPKDQFPGNACPGDAEDLFDDVVVDFPTAR